MTVKTFVKAQAPKPVTWHYTSKPISAGEVELVFTATLEEGWHVYSQFIAEGGPLPTSFSFMPGEGYTLKNEVSEKSIPVKLYDSTFLMDIAWFEKVAVFTQVVKLYVPSTQIRGTIEFMACNDGLCLPPETVRFTLEAQVEKPAKRKTSLRSETRYYGVPGSSDIGALPKVTTMTCVVQEGDVCNNTKSFSKTNDLLCNVWRNSVAMLSKRVDQRAFEAENTGIQEINIYTEVSFSNMQNKKQPHARLIPAGPKVALAAVADGK